MQKVGRQESRRDTVREGGRAGIQECGRAEGVGGHKVGREV